MIGRTARALLIAATMLAGAAGLAPLPAAAESAAGGPAEGLDKEAVEAIVRDYLKRHPEVVVEAIEQWRAQQQQAEEERTREALVAAHDRLFNESFSPVGGNVSGDVTVVEFFDYQCTYCKRVMPGFLRTVEEDGDVRVVFKEFPILGPASTFAAEAALAAKAQGKYFAFHRALMALKAELSEETVMATARSVGLDLERLRADMQSPAVQAEIKRNLVLARRIGVRGTPAFVIGDRLIPGAIDGPALKTLIAEARGKE